MSTNFRIIYPRLDGSVSVVVPVEPPLPGESDSAYRYRIMAREVVCANPRRQDPETGEYLESEADYTARLAAEQDKRIYTTVEELHAHTPRNPRESKADYDRRVRRWRPAWRLQGGKVVVDLEAARAVRTDELRGPPDRKGKRASPPAAVLAQIATAKSLDELDRIDY